MNTQNLAQPDQLHAQSEEHKRMQALQESALFIYEQILEKKKSNLRQRNYPESNAAVTKHEWRHAISFHHGIAPYQIQEIEQSLHQTGQISYFGRDYMQRSSAGEST